MSRVNRYLFNNFLSTFASLFSTLFLIMSIVFFIQIARVTSYIEISFIELAKLYLFALPRVLLFVVPIAFFVSLAMMFFRLSKENESIVIFTLGSSPNSIARFFLAFSSLFSVSLLVIAIVLIPMAAELNANFIDYKKTIAKLNLKPSQFGQKFSEWMIYVGSETNDKNSTTYNDIVMFNPVSNNLSRLIIAKNAKILNLNSSIELSLNDGKSYDIKNDLIHQSNFKTLQIRTKQNERISEVGSIKQYWADTKTNNKRKKDLSTYVLVALFPISTTLFALSLGIVTYRYEKGAVYLGTFGVLFSYFALIMLLSAKPFIAIPTVFLIFFISSIVYYKFKIMRRY
ncbi:LptF/LptG family permease [Campylobacter sp. faydin G-24]|uniref:LptF/LptG family permease n=1 Tax=Campylobacter anatolicus TaxID=2829105 RepID=A0ABS5HK69_9BACT|nr:LptF/LptG family permease [Campylobacter anatolicus]MBR8464022.1 LptF/LptG family permease [Campylobacter anatolicus]MBR8465790.1 LptF/LptG family permease [Campylobacter anatolicus]